MLLAVELWPHGGYWTWLKTLGTVYCRTAKNAIERRAVVLVSARWWLVCSQDNLVTENSLIPPKFKILCCCVGPLTSLSLSFPLLWWCYCPLHSILHTTASYWCLQALQMAWHFIRHWHSIEYEEMRESVVMMVLKRSQFSNHQFSSCLHVD